VDDPLCVVVRGSSWENIDNLSATYKDTLESWRGTRIGRQEIEGEILEDIDGALLTREVLESCRMAADAKIPDLEKVICGVDPAMGSGERANNTGIVVAGVFNGVVYILADKTIKASPDGWGREVVKAYHDYGCDSVVMETNQGGDLVKNVVEQLDPSVQVTGVRATRGKHVRFAPVASLYENRRIIHAKPFDELEDELVLFSPHGYEGSESPDRADALTWAVYELVISRRANPRILDLDW
jgi:phage terminase large subunit-like protein